MSETLSLTSGVPGRYANAVFTLCKDEDKIKDLQKDIEKLSDLMVKSSDFKSLINSPIYNRGEQSKAVGAVGKKIKLQKHTENLLRLMADKGRIYILPQLISDIEALLENERDEIGVEVISAEKLTQGQTDKLEKTLSKIGNKKAKMHVRLDNSLIGGMIVKIGSRMIDTTIKAKLLKLQNIMKEVN
jgi:F-type H+-transporting ATPase subunit delta